MQEFRNQHDKLTIKVTIKQVPYDIASSSEVETKIVKAEVQTTAFRLSGSVFLMVTFAAVLQTIPDNARTDLKMEQF